MIDYFKTQNSNNEDSDISKIDRSIAFSIISLLGKHPSLFFRWSFSSQMGNLDNETNSCRY